MRSLRSLIDWLPYYFKASDTYIKDGKGLFERYLEIFGNYFEDKVVGDINSLDDLIDVDKTPEVYLGYLWEFLGAMPYANPHAIDPEKWKTIFNGFDSPSTIEALKKYWVYPMNTSANSSNDHFDLTDAQVRALVKYSIALFSIRGTRKFFEVLLKLYGLEVEIGQYSAYPQTTVEDDDDSDYYGTDQDYYGTDDDYAGSADSLFESLTEITKLGSEFTDLDGNCQLDNHSSCSRCVTVIFKLKASDGYAYQEGSNTFKRLYKRMYDLINTFLPLGARPHLIFKDIVMGGSTGTFDPKTDRNLEIFIDRMPDTVMGGSVPLIDNGDGWYKFNGTQIAFTSFLDNRPVRLKVKVKDIGVLDGTYGEPTPKTFQIKFSDSDGWSEDFEDGHIFTINHRVDGGISLRATSISPLEYNLETWLCPITIWFHHMYQYEVFNEKTVAPYTISLLEPFSVVVIQSYAGRTSTKNEDPSDDAFISLPVLNFTTGLYLTLIDQPEYTIDIGSITYTIDTSNYVDYDEALDEYHDKHCYLCIIQEPGVYEFRQEARPENSLKVEVDMDYNNAKPTLTQVDGESTYMVDAENPTTDLIRFCSNDSSYLLDIGLGKADIETNTLGIDSSNASLKEAVASLLSGLISVKRISDINSHYLDETVGIDSSDLATLAAYNESLITSFIVSYLTKPVHNNYQTLELTFRKSERGRNESTKQFIIYLNKDENLSPIVSHDSVASSFLYGTEIRITDNYPISCRVIDIPLVSLIKGFFDFNNPFESRSLSIRLKTLYSPNPIIVDLDNPNLKFNSGEGFYLDDPGYYRFKGLNIKNGNYSNSILSIDITSNKYNDKYMLELIDDGNTSDDEEYMLRMAVPENINGAPVGTVIDYTFKVRLTLNMSIIEAQDILTIDPDAFDFNVEAYRGTTPGNGTWIEDVDVNDFEEVLVDDDNNILPNYTVEAEIAWKYVKGNYTVGEITVGEGQSAQTIDNRPPGVYCFRLHDITKALKGTPTYRCINIYEQEVRGENNLFFDVDVISRAWVKPAAQAYDYDNQGNRTWGFYKTHPEFAYAVRSCRYDPAITETMPQFRLNLDNNPIGYKRVMMYKLVDNNSGAWDTGSQYTDISYKLLNAEVTQESPELGHWLNESMGGVPDDWMATENQKWVFTGTVYKLGELITGPQEPGKYIFRIEQLDKLVDNKPINYAYLEVKEDIQYSLIVDPKIAILQGTAVITNVSAISSAKFTKEELVVKVVGPHNQQYSEEYKPPFSFYAYQIGEYLFTLYRREANNTLTQLVQAKFKVLSENGVSDEYLSWNWSDIAEKLVEVATTSTDVDWTVKIQDE